MLIPLKYLFELNPKFMLWFIALIINGYGPATILKKKILKKRWKRKKNKKTFNYI